jgi:hypothetical protein
LEFNPAGTPDLLQSLYFPHPVLSQATLVFWEHREVPTDSSVEYWFISGRPANNMYLVYDSSLGLAYYSDGVKYGNSSLRMPIGLWKQIIVELSNLQAG